MRTGWPSVTAMAVAFFRALASEPGSPFDDVDDPLASALLPGGVGALSRALGSRPSSHRVARLVSAGAYDHVARRTVAIDEVVRAVSPCPQLVLLGAGLDARAYRMPELASTIAFEVDHPDTQALVRRKLGTARSTAREVRFVDVDFATQDFAERLAAAGHDANARTIWIWEGVTMYLPRDAIRVALRSIGQRSAPGSTLAMTYATPEMLSVPAAVLPLTRAAFRVLGEPLLGVMEPIVAAELLAAEGFAVDRDSGSREWPGPAGQPRLQIEERLLVATKR